MNKYFLEAYAGIQFRHGGVGNTDAENILQQEGFTALQLPDDTGLFVKLRRWISVNRMLQRIPEGSMVVVHQPVYPRMHQYLVRRLLKKKVRLVLLVADIDGLKDGDPSVLKREINLFRSCRFFIVHNPAMEAYIRIYAPEARIVQLGPFDFLAAPFAGIRIQQPSINFSGNLSKSPFLENIGQIPGITFHVYGEGCSGAMLAQPNLHYHGIYQAHELPSMIEGSYGLIWDGASTGHPTDALGRYMQYIHHHKLSLYILAGMPVIAPAFSGSAAFIRQHQIGWLINSLQELPSLLENIDASAFRDACLRMRPLAQSISNGMQLRKALAALEKA